MTELATSADGTRIAYDRFGSGPVLIFVDGAMQFRAFDPQTGALAELLAERGLAATPPVVAHGGESAFGQELGQLAGLRIEGPELHCAVDEDQDRAGAEPVVGDTGAVGGRGELGHGAQ
ncbi:MAG TPA: hypothetical protein VNA11_00690, partial [Pseudonocardia sp.]|nr:hypothetical protein [Pseudonocardia sp.]